MRNDAVHESTHITYMNCIQSRLRWLERDELRASVWVHAHTLVSPIDGCDSFIVVCFCFTDFIKLFWLLAAACSRTSDCHCTITQALEFIIIVHRPRFIQWNGIQFVLCCLLKADRCLINARNDLKWPTCDRIQNKIVPIRFVAS